MDRFTSRSSSGHSLSGHTPPDTTVANSSAPSRFVYPPFVRTSRCREAYRRWRTAPLSTMYLLTTSESSIGDSSSESSAGPSHKRCRSPANSVPSSTPVSGSLAPTRADLLPPRKRFRDSYSSEASMEEDTEVGTAEAKVGMELGSGDGIDSRDRIETNPRDVREDREEYEAETSAGDTVELGIDPVSALIVDEEIVEPVGNDSSDSSGTRDGIVRSFEDMPINLDDVVRDFYHHISENMTITRSGMTPEAIEELVNRRVEEALTAYKATRAANALEAESQSQNGSDGDNGNGRNGNGRNRNGGNGNGGNENPNGNDRGARPIARECTYQDFMKCQPLNFKGTEVVAEPTRLQDAVRIANNLMDQKLEGYAVRNAENKRRLDTNQRDNRGQQPPYKRQNTGGQNVARAYTADNNKKRDYRGTLPYYNRWPNQRVNTCYECGAQGHFKKDYPKIKCQNRGNKSRVPDARGKTYVLGGGDANPDANTVTGTFLLNYHHAYVLFDPGTNRSFASYTFSALLDIIPSTLDVSYAVELTNGRTSETNTVLRGCTLGLLGHPFSIDLMPIDLGSFDVIIDMDWLVNNHVVIVCDKKIVCVPYGNEVLIVQGDRSDKEKKSTLSIISCIKTQKYINKGCPVFLAQVTVKETKDNLKEKRLKDVPTVR
ncbi:putative reverse transcriptase domain-containing protein, partial [Tanacetum coccineum]